MAEIFGRLNKNKRKRVGFPDPDMIGWVDFRNGRASIAAWMEDDPEDLGNKRLNLTLKPWGGGRKVYTYGSLHINHDQRAGRASQMIGKAFWAAQELSIAAWFVIDNGKMTHINLTARPIRQQIDYQEVVDRIARLSPVPKGVVNDMPSMRVVCSD